MGNSLDLRRLSGDPDGSCADCGQPEPAAPPA